MKILWIDLNSSYAHSSLALPALHAQMNQDTTIEWEVVSATINENVGIIVGDVLKRQPDLIMATCWLFNHETLLHVLARVKAVLPQSLIILGGPEFLGDNEGFLRKNIFVDAVFRGEGELFFKDFMEAGLNSNNWHEIEGLCYLEYHPSEHYPSEHRPSEHCPSEHCLSKHHLYIDNGLAKVKYFSRLRFPETSHFFRWDKPFVQLETTRGCFNTCAFCVSGGEKPVRTLSLKMTEQRLMEIQQHGIKNVRVLDRTFNYNPKRAKDLLELFKCFPDIRFHLEIHPALLTDELKQDLKALPIGLLHLEAGIQSLREPVLKASRRAGKLSAALEGLRFLCSLNNMETHADLIAGLPLYHLTEIVEDVHTLAEFGCAEIQLESLKLLPGTEMRRRAAELGICYSPFPPYEVLQTNEMTVDELQTARQLSRLLDGFYNAPVWQGVTRKLMLENKTFLTEFLTHLVKGNWIDQPLSLEKRGLILYKFCKTNHPTYLSYVTMAWIEAGMSLKKVPAERVVTKKQIPPLSWEVVYGTYKESLRICFLPMENDTKGCWFGYESEIQKAEPVFNPHCSLSRVNSL